MFRIPSFSGAGKTGKGTIKDNGGDMSIRWSSPAEYYELPPNQILEREVNAPMKFCLDNFNSTKLGNCVLAPGDPNTAVHDLIAVGMVRKTMLNITETVRGQLLLCSHAHMPTSWSSTQVTDVEWSEKKIWHRYRTNMVSGPPCCCILGYGAEMSVEEIGPNKTLLINRAYQETKWCSPLLCCPCPCCCLCWNAIGNSFLVKDVDELEKKWAAMEADKAALL